MFYENVCWIYSILFIADIARLLIINDIIK